jgi:peptidyl-prolyl cis-trans isomerase A (cyclophilin A)
MSALNETGNGAVKMIMIHRHLLGFLAVLGLLAASLNASDTKPGQQGSAGRAEGGPAILLRAAGVVGKPQLISPDGSRVQLSIGGNPSLGSTVETGENDRLAIAIAPTRSTALEQADLLILGPRTRVRFEPAATAEDEANGKPVVQAIIERGAVRALVRQAGAECAFAVRMGERTMSLKGADLVADVDPEQDDVSLYLHNGSLVLLDGDRKIRLKGGMMRIIEEGRILGARTMQRSTWDEAVALAAVPGVDVTQVVAAAVTATGESSSGDESGGEVSTADERPEREKPTVTGSSAGNKPAVRQPGEQEATSREAPPGERRELPTISAQKPGTTKREIVEEYVYVRMTTTAGDIVLELDRGRAPITVDNFLAYLKTGFYEGTIFHRVMSNFMIQGGGYDTNWEKKQTGPPIKSEWPTGLRNLRGTIAMARRNTPDSATSQFFINVTDNAFLDSPPGTAGYTVFGKVIDGMDVVDAIKDAPVQQSRLNRREKAEPVEPVVIEKVELITAEEAGVKPTPEPAGAAGQAGDG